MAVYKVPQDVEADDKLLGPLSFRQFLYAVGAVISGTVMFFMGKLFIGLIIIPLPFLILFSALALPLRKDQPMEMYLYAVIRFFLKPRMRLWQPEGYVAMVEIVAPQIIEEQRTNGLSQNEARNRLGYLAQVMDSRGWSTRGVAYPGGASGAGIMYADSDIANDIMDKDENVARNFEELIAKKDVQREQETKQKIVQWRSQGANSAANSPPAAEPGQSPSLDDIITQQQQTPLAATQSYPNSPSMDDSARLNFDPYPNAMHQRVIRPLGDSRPARQAVAPSQTPLTLNSSESVTTTVSPDIIKLALAESKNLSISTLANEAHRLEQKHDENEVVISLH